MITRAKLRQIIRETISVSPEGKATHKDYHDSMRLEDDSASIIMIDVLGYQPNEAELDKVYEAVTKIIDLIKTK